MIIKIDPDEAPQSASVHTLPVKPRPAIDAGRVLTEVHSYACQHGAFIIDTALEQVTCGRCKERLSPMYVLQQLTRQETRYHELHARYADEMARLATRSKKKCEHCDKITRISKA